MKKRKCYLYYGTEENGFEVEKHECLDIVNDVKQFLVADFIEEEKAEEIAKKMREEYNSEEENGFALYEGENGQGYEIMLMVVRYGMCSSARELLKEKRERMEMYYRAHDSYEVW